MLDQPVMGGGFAGAVYRNRANYSALEDPWSYPYVDPAYAPGQLNRFPGMSDEFGVGTTFRPVGFVPPFNIPAPWDFLFPDPYKDTEGVQSGAVPPGYGDVRETQNTELIAAVIIGGLALLYFFKKRA